MTKVKNKWFVVPIFMLTFAFFSMFLTGKAYADSVTVTTSPSYGFFQTFSSEGVWKELGTPNHTITNTGRVAYCLQTEYTSPNNSGYTSMDWQSAYDQTTLDGLRAILENGYPMTNGGFTDNEARYATANAIRFWLAERGCAGVPAWMDLTKHSQFFRGSPGYESLYSYALNLLECARNKTFAHHSVELSPSTIELEQNMDGWYVGSTTVNLVNCKGGYEIDRSTLPLDIELRGYTGKDGDTLTFVVGTTYIGSIVNIVLNGIDNQSEASLLFYAPQNSGEQRILAYTLDVYGKAVSKTLTLSVGADDATGSILIIKTDGDTGYGIENAYYSIYRPNGDFLVTLPTDDGGYIRLGPLPLGTYTYQEVKSPPGYALDPTVYSATITRHNETVRAERQNYRSESFGGVQVKKIDAAGQSLSGAEFLLEVSEDDGSTWEELSRKETDSSGLASFDELNTVALYRLTETKAPTGHSLSAGIVYEGSITDDTVLSFTVCDCAIPILPFTGSAPNFIPLIPLMLCMGFLYIIKRKEKLNEKV